MLTFGTLAVLRWPPCGDKANVTVPGPFFLHGLRVAIRRR